MGDDGEPIRIWEIHDKRRVQRWATGYVSHHAFRHVEVGTLPDGRWYADHTADGARAYRSEQAARTAVERMMADGEWREVPAEYGPDGPVGWVRYGNDWRRVSPAGGR